MRARPAACALVALAAGSLSWAPAARADRGVAVDVGHITITERLAAGGTYRLPPLGIRNPGTERTTYRLTVSYLERQEARRPPAVWFRFSPSILTLAPGKSRPVTIRLALPESTTPGIYKTLVGAQIASESGGAQVGAAAAARLTFTVASEGGGDRVWTRIASVGSSPWTYAFAGLALLVLALVQIRRRFRIRITRRA